mmetsp:Transcript_14080/g.46259  ORF Transcript_14080/g.46259 Transcript_14080/m.46259 type:complete len:102 (+) Transcript_14080:32-337(+)
MCVAGAESGGRASSTSIDASVDVEPLMSVSNKIDIARGMGGGERREGGVEHDDRCVGCGKDGERDCVEPVDSRRAVELLMWGSILIRVDGLDVGSRKMDAL